MGETTGIGEEQLSFLSEMLDEPSGEKSESFDTEENQEGSAETQESNEKTEAQIDEPGDKTLPEQGVAESEESGQISESEQTIQSLREQIIALTSMVGTDPKVQQVQETVQTEEAKVQGQAKELAETYLTEDELDRLIDEPGLINVAIKRSQDALIGSVGTIINQEIQRQLMVTRAVSDFYQENNDLLPYAKYVQFVMAEIETKQPDKTYGEIFKTTAEECRKRLGLMPKAGRPSQNNQTQKPAFAGSKRGNSRPAGKQDIFDEAARDMLS